MRGDQSFGGDEEADDAAELAWEMNDFAQKRTRRVNFELQWEETAAMIWPGYRGSFFFGRDLAPGQKRSQFQIDNTAALYNRRHAAIVEWLTMPTNMIWSQVEFESRDLMKDRDAQLWCSEVTKILWEARYKGSANFVDQNQQNLLGLGPFGNMAMWTDELDTYLDPGERGLRYMGCPIGEWYIEEDHQKRVVGGTRYFKLDAQQFKTRWPKSKIPVIEAALAISDKQLFGVLHVVRPRTDYDPSAIFSDKGKRYVSKYISVEGYCFIERGGYRTLPLAYGRYGRAPDETYARGPGMETLDMLKTRNAEKRVFLKQGHRAGDPAYLVPDTGLIDLKTQPGAWNAGGMSADGKPLVGILPTGQIQVTQEMMEADDAIIQGFFLVDLFQQVLGDKTGQMGARQVVEYINERGILLAPTVGGLLPSYCDPLIDRELDILSWLRKLPPLPPICREASRAECKIVYTNAISRAMQSEESAGYMRTFEFAAQAVQAGADPALLDIFELDTALPAIGRQGSAPPEWFSGPKSLAAKRQARAQAQQQSDAVKSLPGQAAIMKAKAIAAKAATGGNTGGTLSGTPEGGMPMMPGQTEPGGTPPQGPSGMPMPQQGNGGGL